MSLFSMYSLVGCTNTYLHWAVDVFLNSDNSGNRFCLTKSFNGPSGYASTVRTFVYSFDSGSNIGSKYKAIPILCI